MAVAILRPTASSTATGQSGWNNLSSNSLSDASDSTFIFSTQGGTDSPLAYFNMGPVPDDMETGTYKIFVRAALSVTGDDICEVTGWLNHFNSGTLHGNPVFRTVSTTTPTTFDTSPTTATLASGNVDGLRTGNLVMGIRAQRTRTMSADPNTIRIHDVWMEVTYTPLKAPPATPVITNPIDLSSISGTTSLEATVTDPDGEAVRAEWELWGDGPLPKGTEVYSFANTQGADTGGIAWDGTHMWMSDYGVDIIYRLNISNNTIDRSFPAATDTASNLTVLGLMWDGTYLWQSNFTGGPTSGSLIQKLNPLTGAVVSSFPAPGTNTGGLAWDGTNIWVCEMGTDQIHKMNPSTGAILQSFPAPGTGPRGVAWDGSGLWVSDQNTDLVYRVSTVNGEVLESFSLPTGSPMGLTWDGSNFWTADSGTDRVYKLANGVSDIGFTRVESISNNTTTVASGTTHSTIWDSSAHSGGEYKIRAWAFNTSGKKSLAYDEHTITLSSGPADTIPPSIPTGLTLADYGFIDISWTASTDDVTAQSAIVYELSRAPDSGESPGVWAVAQTSDPGSTNLVDSPGYGTFWYRVRARDTANNWSDYSTAASINIPLPPAPPKLGLQTDSIGMTSISVSATLNGGPLTGETANTYEFERNGVSVQNNSSSILSSTGLSSSTSYTFRVRGHNEGGAGPWSDPHIVDTLAAPQTSSPSADGGISGAWVYVPSAPGWACINDAPPTDTTYVESPDKPDATVYHGFKLAALGNPGATTTGHILRYRIAKSSDGGVGIDMTIRLYNGDPQTGGVEVASWSHTGLTTTWQQFNQTLTTAQANTITNYSNLYVRFDPTTTGGGQGAAARLSWLELEVPPAVPLEPPGTITDLTATATGQTQVALSWTEPADNGTSILYYEYRYGSPYSAWTSTGSTNTSYTVTSLASGTSYDFQVRAVTEGGSGLESNTATATTLTPTPPSVPTGLLIDTSSFPTWAYITWSASTDDSTPVGSLLYELSRAPDAGGVPGTYVTINSTLQQLNYEDQPGDGTWWYRVRAQDGDGLWSGYSTAVSGTVFTPPAPTEVFVVTVGAITHSTIELSATYNGETLINDYTYEWERDGVTVAGEELNSWIDGALLPETTYSYRVRAHSLGGPGPWSAATQATTTVAPATTAITTFAGLADGSYPPDWIPMLGPAEGSYSRIVASADYSDGRALVMESAYDYLLATRSDAWTVVNAKNLEVRARLRGEYQNSGLNDFSVMARIDPAGSGSLFGGAWTHSTDGESVGIARHDAVGDSVLRISETLSIQNYYPNVWYQIRMRLITDPDGVNATYQFKIWEDSTTEPAAWTTETYRAEIWNFSGYIGFGRVSTANVELDAISAGWDGSDAPVLPPLPTEQASGPAAPTNVSVTQNKKDVILTWDSVPGVSGYKVFRNGKILANTTSTSYTDISPPLGLHKYKIHSYVSSP